MLSKTTSMNTPLLIILFMILTIVTGPYLSLDTKRTLFSISLITKDVIVFLLPVIIFMLIFISVARLGQGVFSFIAWLVPMICLSNFTGSWIGYFSGTFLLKQLKLQPIINNVTELLSPNFLLQIPKLVSMERTIITAVVTAYLLQKFMPLKAVKLGEVFDVIATFLLKKVFIPCTPLLICGFILKMQHEELLNIIFSNYLLVIVGVLCTQVIYISILYLIAYNFNLNLAYKAIKNMLPAVLTGFSTLSSAAALPLMLEGVEENIVNKRVTKFVVPSTVNFHLIGDCIAIPIFALVVMRTFGFPAVDPSTYLIFSAYVVIAKFGVAAIPGGGMLVIWPLLESIFGFNVQMLAMTHALYMLFDAFITSMNILGNGVFAIIYYKVLMRSGHAIKTISS